MTRKLVLAISLLALTSGACAGEDPSNTGEDTAETDSALDGNRIQKSGDLIIGAGLSGSGAGAICHYIVGMTRRPTPDGRMVSTGSVNCQTNNLYFTVALYLTRGDGYFDGTNLCAACGTAVQRRDGSDSKTMKFGQHRGTWKASLFFADDAGGLNASVSVSTQL